MTDTREGLEQAFLDDIVAHAEDPSLWLILADWLDEREDPRGELVRLTWSLQYEPDHADFAARQERVQALLAGGLVPVRPRRTLGGIDFAWVPPGSFLMGSPPDEAEHGDIEKQHRVTLTQGFWMGVHPVTQAQWRALMGTNPSHFSRTGGGKDSVKKIGDADLKRFPVENVSWDMAQDFCVKLSERLGKQIVLPSEAQWEYACRAGTKTPYHFGSVLNGKQANCNGNYPHGTTEKGPYLARPTPVGLEAYPANAWNLRDLHGNVWEWCADWYDDYPTEAVQDPLGASGGVYRVCRGGAWPFVARDCRSARRGSNAPGNRNTIRGFRLAVSVRPSGT